MSLVARAFGHACVCVHAVRRASGCGRVGVGRRAGKRECVRACSRLRACLCTSVHFCALRVCVCVCLGHEVVIRGCASCCGTLLWIQRNLCRVVRRVSLATSQTSATEVVWLPQDGEGSHRCIKLGCLSSPASNFWRAEKHWAMLQQSFDDNSVLYARCEMTEPTLTPWISAVPRRRTPLLMANLVLSKDPSLPC